MKTTTMTRNLTISALAAGALVAPAQPALADVTYFFPAGTACDFNLQFTATGGNLTEKEFVDENGNTVRLLQAGKGTVNTYTNYGTNPKKPVKGESISIRTDGSVTEYQTNPDGTLTVTATGHNGLIMFPSDDPAGPSTIQYTGKIVYTIDPATGVFTLVSTSGGSIDICAELAS